MGSGDDAENQEHDLEVLRSQPAVEGVADPIADKRTRGQQAGNGNVARSAEIAALFGLLLSLTASIVESRGALRGFHSPGTPSWGGTGRDPREAHAAQHFAGSRVNGGNDHALPKCPAHLLFESLFRGDRSRCGVRNGRGVWRHRIGPPPVVARLHAAGRCPPGRSHRYTGTVFTCAPQARRPSSSSGWSSVLLDGDLALGPGLCRSQDLLPGVRFRDVHRHWNIPFAHHRRWLRPL